MSVLVCALSEGQMTTLGVTLRNANYYFETGPLSSAWNSPVRLGWWASGSQASFCLCLQVLGLRVLAATLAFPHLASECISLVPLLWWLLRSTPTLSAICHREVTETRHTHKHACTHAHTDVQCLPTHDSKGARNDFLSCGTRACLSSFLIHPASASKMPIVLVLFFPLRYGFPGAVYYRLT